MVSMRKDVLSVSVKSFVNKRKEDLNAFSTTSLRIRKFEISCWIIEPRYKEPCCRLNNLYSSHFPGKLFPLLDQNYSISTSYGRLNCLKTILLQQHIPMEYSPRSGSISCPSLRTPRPAQSHYP